MPLFTTLIFGLLASCFALVLEVLTLGMPLFSLQSSLFFFDLGHALTLHSFGILATVAVIEETAKCIFLIQYTKFSVARKVELPSFVAVALFFGIGFSTLECILAWHGGTFPVFPLLRTLLFHSITTLIFTAYLSVDEEKFRVLSIKNFFVLLAAVLVHLGFNIALFLWG